MNAKEKAIRDAAQALRVAIADGEAAGLSVTWPRRVADLASIEISSTGAMPDEPESGASKKPAGTPKK